MSKQKNPISKEFAEAFASSLPAQPIELIAKRNGLTVEQAQKQQEKLRQELIDALCGKS